MKKTAKLLAVVLSVLMLVSVCSVTAFAEEAATDYSVTGISTLAQLEDFAAQVAGAGKYIGKPNNYEGKTVNLLADIGSVDSQGNPVKGDCLQYSIGTGIGILQSPWKGVFDGNGHTVVVNITALYAGLFRDNQGTIRNVAVAGKVKSLPSGVAGGICGHNQGTIQNCCNKASVEVADISCGGGITGTNTGVVENCYSVGTFTVSETASGAGGVVGNNMLGTIINSFWDISKFEGDGVYPTSRNPLDSKNQVTGLTTDQCKAADGLAAFLNNYVNEKGANSGLLKWAAKGDYPVFDKTTVKNTTKKTSPKTGYNTVSVVMVVLMMVSLASVAFCAVKSR